MKNSNISARFEYYTIAIIKPHPKVGKFLCFQLKKHQTAKIVIGKTEKGSKKDKRIGLFEKNKKRPKLAYRSMGV